MNRMDVFRAEQRLASVRTKYLELRGWTATSKTPGCYWLWAKKVADGRTLLCDIVTAVQLQLSMDTDYQHYEPKKKRKR